MTTLRYPVPCGSEASTFFAKRRSMSACRQSLSISALIALFFLLVSCVSGQQASERVSLWKIERDEAVVYLLGSVHALTPDAYPLPNSMERAFKESSQTVFEVDLSQANEEVISKLVQELGFYHSSRTLKTELSEDTLKLLKSHLVEKAIQFEAVQTMKPWFLSLKLAMEELASLDYEAELGIDRYFQLKARSMGKPVMQLESISGQLQLLASDSPDIQELSLRAGIEESSQAAQQLEALVDAWRRGDADKMWRVAIGNSPYPALDAQIEKLIDNRNALMAKKIAEYLQSKQTTLVVVGALHMGGERGILNLMSADNAIEQMGPE